MQLQKAGAILAANNEINSMKGKRMNKKTILGLDLGIASIGWALTSLDESGLKLVAWGSRIFEPGMEDDIESGKGKSRCANRREKRSLRRQYRRRRERKTELVRLLAENGMMPEKPDAAFFTRIDGALLAKVLQAVPKDSQENAHERSRLAHLIPYLYRKLALERDLTKEELGRALYHLAQRRGYLSNRRRELKSKEEIGAVKDGIRTLRRDMAEAHAPTLGAYFAALDPERDHVRRRYTERSMYEDEFSKICERQRRLVSKELEEKLRRAIFFQRPLRSSKGLIGACRRYPELKRCSYLHDEAQQFRLFCMANNLRVKNRSGEIRPLAPDEWNRTTEVLQGFHPDFKTSGTITLAKLGKTVGLAKGEKFTLSDDEKEIHGNQLNVILFRAFGPAAQEMSPEKRRKFLNDLNCMEKEDALKRRLTGFWGLSEEKAAEAMNAPLPDSYCAYSLKALRELLPSLKARVPLARIEKLENPRRSREGLDLLPLVDSPQSGIDLRNPVVRRVLTELRRVVNAIVRRHGRPDEIHVELARGLKANNKERAGIVEKARAREKERARIAAMIAKEAGIANPSRRDIEKVLLAEECEFTCPYSGQRFNMKDLFGSNDVQIEHIIPYSRSFDDSFANKTLSFAEWNAKKGNRSPYEAFGETPEYELMTERVKRFKGDFAKRKLELFQMKKVDEQEFLSRNLNDTRYASKLAMRYLGLLYDCDGDAPPDASSSGDRRPVPQRLFATSGGCTAFVRWAWDGNSVLGTAKKCRSDHRHHAIDALTIALTTQGIVQKVAKTFQERGKGVQGSYDRLFCELYGTENALGDIRDQAKKMLDECAVTHHVVNRLRGPLHNETIYDKRANRTNAQADGSASDLFADANSQDRAQGDESEHHVRIALENLKVKDIPDIIDDRAKRLIFKSVGIVSKEELRKFTKEEIAKRPKDERNKLFFKMCKGDPNTVYWTDSFGSRINRIKKVRVRRNQKTIRIGEGDRAREVANGENHTLAVFAVLDENGREIGWTGEIVSLLDAIRRRRAGKPLFEMPATDGKGHPLKFKFTLQKGDVVRWSKDGEDLLCIVRGVSLPQFSCVPILDARTQMELKAAERFFVPTPTLAFKCGMRKFTMNVFGELREAHD